MVREAVVWEVHGGYVMECDSMANGKGKESVGGKREREKRGVKDRER